MDADATYCSFFGLNKLVSTEDLLEKIVPDTPQSSLFEKITKAMVELRDQLNISVDIVPLPYSSQNCYWSDYASAFLGKKHNHTFFNDLFIYFAVYMDQQGANLNLGRPIALSFSPFKAEMKRKVLDCFYAVLPEHYEWSGDNNEVMLVHYAPRPIRRLDYATLRSNDTYPNLRLRIKMKKKGLIDYAIQNLSVVKELQELFKKKHDYKTDMEYGSADVELEIRCVAKDNVEELCRQIESIMKQNMTTGYPPLSERVQAWKCDYYHWDEYFRFPLKGAKNKDKFIKFLRESNAPQNE